MEVWWDSSPLIYKSWLKKVIDKTEDSYKAVMKKQLDSLFDYDNPLDMAFAGVTTNPKLTSNILDFKNI